MTGPRDLSDDLTWAIRLARRGSDRRTILAALTRRHRRHGHHSLVYGQQVQERGFEAARRYAERTVDKALTIVASDPQVLAPDEARSRLSVIHAAAWSRSWPLQLAGARRALEAAFIVGFDRGFVANLHLDLRTHAMRAGQSFAAIRRHRAKLGEIGWMSRNPHDRGARTSRVSFRVPQVDTCNDPSGGRLHVSFGLLRGVLDPPEPPTAPMSLHVSSVVLLAHDAWRPKALGDQAWMLHRLRELDLPEPDGSDRAADALQEVGLLDVVGDPAATLRRLDLVALQTTSFNTGYREGMGFLAERAARRHYMCPPGGQP